MKSIRNIVLAVLCASATAAAQTTAPPAPPASPARPALPADPVVGNWRGTLTSASGVESSIIITIVKKGDQYAGSTNGLNAASESALKRVTASGANLTDRSGGRLEARRSHAVGGSHGGRQHAQRQRHGVGRRAEVRRHARAAAAAARRGDSTARRTARRLLRRPVEGQYLGAEYPPLSPGGRSGTMTFTKAGASNFVSGRLDGELLGKPYQEQLSIEMDPETNMLAVVDKRPDGVELVSVASWRSPIAITFQTSPVQANGKIVSVAPRHFGDVADGIRRHRGVLGRRRPLQAPRQWPLHEADAVACATINAELAEHAEQDRISERHETDIPKRHETHEKSISVMSGLTEFR